MNNDSKSDQSIQNVSATQSTIETSAAPEKPIDWHAKYENEHDKKKKLNKQKKKITKTVKKLTAENKTLKAQITQLEANSFIHEHDYF